MPQWSLHQILDHSEVLLRFRASVGGRLSGKVKPWDLTFFEISLDNFLDIGDPIVP